MSIYATLWNIKLPVSDGIVMAGHDDEWIEVVAQAVPPHIGWAYTTGYDYQDGPDHYADILPPRVDPNAEGDTYRYRAVFFIDDKTSKGTKRNGQEYVNPILMLTGEEYETIGWHDLFCRLTDALEERWFGHYRCEACGRPYRAFPAWRNVHCGCGALQPWSATSEPSRAVYLP